MTVWTIQPLSALEEIRQRGTYRCRKELSYNLNKKNSLKPRYEWLMRQMEQRIGQRSNGVEYPVWAWHTWDYAHRCPEPDSPAFLKRTEDKVLLTLDIPDEELVLTDFDAWQIVMMGGYLMGTEELLHQEEVETYLDSLTEQEYRQEVEKSWLRVFHTEAAELGDLQLGRYVQATFWEIKKQYVSDYQVLTAENTTIIKSMEVTQLK